MTSLFYTGMSEGHANMLSNDYEKGANQFLVAVEETVLAKWQSDSRWVYSRCALARAAFYAYGLGALSGPFARFGNVIGILTDAHWLFRGPRSLAYIEVGRAYMEFADYSSLQANSDDDSVMTLYSYGREMFQRLTVSAEDELAHCLYRFHSYRAFPGVIGLLRETRGILERHNVEFTDPSESPVRSSIRIDRNETNENDDVLMAWRALIYSVAQRNGSPSVELLDCAIAAARHLHKYDRIAAARIVLTDALELLRANPELDREGLRREYIGRRLEAD